MRSRALLILIFVGVCLRAGLWLCYEPVAYPDTPTYVDVARNLLTGDFSKYEGRRTPGYPALIAVARLDARNVWLLQMAIGVIISCLLFYVVLLLTGRTDLALVSGLTYNVNLAQLFMEGTIMTETVGTLGLVAVVALALIVYRRLRDRRPVAGVIVLLGLVVGFATLTRPQFIFLPLVVPLLVAYASWIIGRSNRRVILRHMVLAALPSVFLVLGWCSVNYVKLGSFTFSTQSSMGLVEQALGFIELAPDRYATIRDIYVRHRDAKVARVGHYRGVEYDGFPDIRAATGLSRPALDRELSRMSVELFLRHPLRYAVGVMYGWIDFWMVPNYWRLELLQPAWLAPPLSLLWSLEHWLLRILNLAFVLLLAACVVSKQLRYRIGWSFELFTISALVIFSSIVQALTAYAENARYGVTSQALVVVVILLAVSQWRRSVEQPAPETSASGELRTAAIGRSLSS